jgi:hypothetical protein
MLFFSRRPAPAELIARLLRLPEHAWIARDQALLRSLAGFFALLPVQDLTTLEKRGLLLLYCNQRLSAAFHQFEGREIVMIFPELRRLLTSAQYHHGYAVLAHELGHVLKGHSRKAVDPMVAQLEADAFARDLGLGDDLRDVLSLEEPCEETRIRIAKLG